MAFSEEVLWFFSLSHFAAASLRENHIFSRFGVKSVMGTKPIDSDVCMASVLIDPGQRVTIGFIGHGPSTSQIVQLRMDAPYFILIRPIVGIDTDNPLRWIHLKF